MSKKLSLLSNITMQLQRSFCSLQQLELCSILPKCFISYLEISMSLVVKLMDYMV